MKGKRKSNPLAGSTSDKPVEVITYPNKSPNRVPACYNSDTKEWEAQYNMLLPDGVSCGDCVHSERCITLFGGKDANTSCQFYPSRFVSKI